MVSWVISRQRANPVLQYCTVLHSTPATPPQPSRTAPAPRPSASRRSHQSVPIIPVHAHTKEAQIAAERLLVEVPDYASEHNNATMKSRSLANHQDSPLMAPICMNADGAQLRDHLITTHTLITGSGNCPAWKSQSQQFLICVWITRHRASGFFPFSKQLADLQSANPYTVLYCRSVTKQRWPLTIHALVAGALGARDVELGARYDRR